MPNIPPQNLEVELQILGALLLDGESIAKIADLLTPDRLRHLLLQGGILEHDDVAFQDPGPHLSDPA